MLGSFLQPVLHFPFDDARVDAVAARLDSFTAHFLQQPVVPSFKRLGRPAVAFRQAALENLKAAGKRKAIGVQAGRVGQLGTSANESQNAPTTRHIFPEVRPSASRCEDASACWHAAGLGASFVRRKPVHVPNANGIPGINSQAGYLALVQQVGEERVFFLMADALRIVQRVLDYAHDDSLAVFFAVVRIGIDLRQIRAVGELL